MTTVCLEILSVTSPSDPVVFLIDSKLLKGLRHFLSSSTMKVYELDVWLAW